MILSDPKILQNIVNKTMKKNVKFIDFEDSGDDETKDIDPEDPALQHKAKMVDGGFTLVEEGDDNMASKKHKVADGINTTMLGITDTEA